ncbi:MAG: hypothetical protein P8R42_06170 [Candidatus Binatia bacterium]|nr:hypothetical protein [Candidatus Binatia bacterium]
MDIDNERGGGGVRFARLAPLPPLRLEESQVVGLWLSVQLARRATGLPFSEDSGAALNKVLAALSDARRQKLRQLYGRILVGRPAGPRLRASAEEICPTLLEAFERCFSLETCLNFTYERPRGEHDPTARRAAWDSRQLPLWYILAVDVDKDAPRMFRMDRISDPRPFARPFVPSRSLVHEMVEEIPDVTLERIRAGSVRVRTESRPNLDP